MREAISNTSPLLYLHRIGALRLLVGLFGKVWVPGAALAELEEGRLRGCDVPDGASLNWLALDLGAGELAAMALAL